MTKLSITLLLSVFLMMISACVTLQVTSPAANQTSSQDFKIVGDKIQITVTFNKDVDINTIVVGKTFLFNTEKEKNAQGTILPGIDKKTIIFLSAKKATELLIYDSDGNFSIKLIGSDTGNGAIKGTDGKHLDGDRDKNDGGDYQTSFVHVG